MTDTGGDPETVVECTNCGNVYPAQRENGAFRPVGTEGTCECGHDDFESVPPSE